MLDSNKKVEYDKITFTLPKETIKYLRENTDNMSKFVKEALDKEIKKEKKEKAWQELLAAPPTHTHVKDPIQYIRDMRQEDEKRLERLYKDNE